MLLLDLFIVQPETEKEAVFGYVLELSLELK